MAKKQRTIDEKITRLRTFNIVAGSLHLIQALGLGYVLTLLDDQVTFPVTADYLGGPPGVDLPAERVIRSLNNIIEWRGKPRTIRVDNVLCAE